MRLLDADPGNADILHLLGILACQRGDPDRAVHLIGEAIAREPQRASYHANLAVALRQLGRPAAVLEALARAQALAPEDAGIAYNLGAALQAEGRHADAVPHYERVLAILPDDADALSNLGHALLQTGRVDEALAPLRRAVARAPAHAAARTNLGLALLRSGDAAGAQDCLRQVAAARPDDAAAHLNLGLALRAGGRFGDAIAAFRQASALAPEQAEGEYHLASVLREIGRPDEAAAACDRALARAPANPDIWRDRLAVLLYLPGIAPAARFTVHRRFAAAFAGQRGGPRPQRAAEPDRRLRVAYLSSDFRHHPVARNIEPLLAHRDQQRFSVCVYADIRQADPVTAHFRALADTWRDVADLSDDALAGQIRTDGIDILVTLAGRFDRNRPLVALRRPAPIQISLHDPATSGLAEVDYLIADRHLVARDSRERFAERVLRLPTFYVHRAPDLAPAPGTPDDHAARPVTFASFCHPAKLNPGVLALWGSILARSPGARLQLLHRRRFGEPELQRRIRAALGAAGAAAEQVEFLADELAREAHLARYRHVDIALDPFPFAGSTATFEALWMGVPVVTLAGDAMVGRWTLAMLRAAKLDEWIADTPAQYANIALALARDPARRAELRHGLRARITASPLCDGPRRARQVERLYRAVWRRWCARSSGAGAP